MTFPEFNPGCQHVCDFVDSFQVLNLCVAQSLFTRTTTSSVLLRIDGTNQHIVLSVEGGTVEWQYDTVSYLLLGWTHGSMCSCVRLLPVLGTNVGNSQWISSARSKPFLMQYAVPGLLSPYSLLFCAGMFTSVGCQDGFIVGCLWGWWFCSSFGSCMYRTRICISTMSCYLWTTINTRCCGQVTQR